MSSSSSFLIAGKSRQLEEAYLEELLLRQLIWKTVSLKASNSFTPKSGGRVSNLTTKPLYFSQVLLWMLPLAGGGTGVGDDLGFILLKI